MRESFSETERSPFSPGRGGLPPFLAGRESEQATIRRFLKALAARKPFQSDIILYGPRGVGKTTLLAWAGREAQGLKVRKIDLTGGEIQSKQDLAEHLAARPGWLDRLRGLTAFAFGPYIADSPKTPVFDHLALRVRAGPLLIAVDEAHMLGIEPGRILLNIIQVLQRKDLPAMLVLAGTPDLPKRLRSMGASFWDRGERLPISRLRSDAAAEAIRVPFVAKGRSIDDDAVTQVVRESHRYPFFLQVWGDELWRDSQDPAVAVTLADVARARPRFELRRDTYYDERVEELDRDELVPVAAEVARVFVRSDRVVREAVRLAIRASLEQMGRVSDHQAVRRAERRLRHVGYVWPVIHQSHGCYEPGIPSLMRFVSTEAKIREQLRE